MREIANFFFTALYVVLFAIAVAADDGSDAATVVKHVARFNGLTGAAIEKITNAVQKNPRTISATYE